MSPEGNQSYERRTDSGIEIRPVYGPADLEGWDPAVSLGEPGQEPYTRGVHPDMYRSRLWTIDLPTQMGYDSDHEKSEGEVGKVGVAIDSLADMRLLLADLPLDKVTTSMTINSTASILLLLYQLVAEEQGVPGDQLGGTIQNDILKEYVARGTYIYPPRPSMRLITDTFTYCAEHMANWNTISISGYHIREAGSTGSRTWRRPSRRVWPSTRSPPGSRSSGTPTTTCSRRWRSSGPRAACGRAS